MKSRRISIALSALLFSACCLAGFRIFAGGPHTLQVTSATESSFLKAYTPQNVIEHFQCNLPSSERPSEISAGQESVNHKFGFHWHFAMPAAKWMPLMDALRDDVAAQLVDHRAQVLGQSGDERSGFHFEYKLGKSFGTLTISPLEITPPYTVHRAMPLPEGTIETTVKVEVAEQWFPKGPGVMQVKLTSLIH